MITNLVLFACAPPPDVPSGPWVERSDERMSTTVSLLVAPHPDGEAAADAGMAALVEVERIANEWKPGSPLAAINEAGGGSVESPPELLALLARSLELAEETHGAFDPTWAALWDLWDFRARRLPSRAEVASRLPHVGWRGVVLDDPSGTVRLVDPEAKLGLGAIAKGWALDGAADELRARGIDDFLISAGGQVLAGGHRDGRPWRVGVRDPRGARDEHFAMVEVSDASVSTSGDYERFFEQDGVRYHHILDPRTGWPSRGLRSATVVCPDATTADALSTALMVLGPVEGLALAARRPDVLGALLVDERGEVHVHETSRASFVVARPPRP